MNDYEISLLATKATNTVDNLEGCCFEKIDDTHFMLAYGVNNASTGRVSIYSTNSDYTTITVMSSYVSLYKAEYCSLFKIDDTHFILFHHRRDTRDLVITTLAIDGSYNISVVNTLVYADYDTYFPSAQKIDDTHFLCVMQEIRDEEYVVGKTFFVDGSYNISVIDSYDFGHDDDDFGDYLQTFAIDSNHYGIVHRDGSIGRNIRVCEIDSSYQISSTSYLDESGDFRGIICSGKLDDNHFVFIIGAYLQIYNMSSSYTFTKIKEFTRASSFGSSNICIIDASHILVATAYVGVGNMEIYSVENSYQDVTLVDSLSILPEDYRQEIVGYKALFPIDVSHYILVVDYATDSSHDYAYVKTYHVNVPLSDTSNFFHFF